MDKKLHLLESFKTKGSDGSEYKVFGYEHLVRDPVVETEPDRWESTGQIEYRLADGTRLDASSDGSLRIEATSVSLSRDSH
jgi:hypothetical protein